MYKIIEKTISYIKIGLTDNEPIVYHLVKSGTKCSDKKPMWLYFIEDGYQLEPYQSGVRLVSEKYISEKFKITL